VTVGLLLTGGASRRLGADKAAALGPRTAAVLEAAVDGAVVEVGPGHTSLPQVREEAPGRGPLAAVAAAVAALPSEDAVVLACDLPFVGEPLLRFLAGQLGTVVPVVDGREQWLCARYSAAALARAASLVATGERRMEALAAADGAVFLDEDGWGAVAGPLDFADVDTPEDAARLGVVVL
jgi:molybdopterin-guanine dinucleotide biosynthesis protein A